MNDGDWGYELHCLLCNVIDCELFSSIVINSGCFSEKKRFGDARKICLEFYYFVSPLIGILKSDNCNIICPFNSISAVF